jgi:DNA-binding GntR family transcriptional regulator
MSTTKRRPLAPLTPQSLAELAYESIRESVLSGRLAMGERIVESRVAAELGTSRAPVREALRRLSEERLVVEKPRHGSYVREISAADFIDIYNLRIALETAAIRLVTRRQPPLDEFENTIRQLDRAAASENLSKVLDLELAVHQVLCEASGNSYLAAAFRSVAGPVRMALGVDAVDNQGPAEIASEHPPLLDAIRTGDENHAAEVVRDHIVASVGPVLERLGGRAEDLLSYPVDA